MASNRHDQDMRPMYRRGLLRHSVRVVVAFVALFVRTPEAWAQTEGRRMALVIGNSVYAHTAGFCARSSRLALSDDAES